MKRRGRGRERSDGDDLIWFKEGLRGGGKDKEKKERENCSLNKERKRGTTSR